MWFRRVLFRSPQVRAGAGQAIAIGVGDIVARAVISGPEPRADFPAIVAEGGAPVAAAIDVAMRPAVNAPVLPQFLPRSAERSVGQECVSTGRSRWSAEN